MLCELFVGLGNDTVDGSEIWHPPVEVGKNTPLFAEFYNIPGAGFLPSTVSPRISGTVPKMEGFESTLFSAILGVGVPFLHKPSPYSFYRFSDSSILGTDRNVW